MPSWGAKSTAAVLGRYHRLEGIPRDDQEWDIAVRGAARLAQNLRDHEAEVLLYRDLATLRRDVPLDEELSDLEWQGVPRTGFLWRNGMRGSPRTERPEPD